jgi:hypothetical protein
LRRRFLAIAVLVAALLIPAASAQAFAAKLKAPTHHPKAGKPWVIHVSARRGNGRPVHASSYYQFVFNGQVVATRYPSPNNPHRGHRHKPWKFRGSYRDLIVWPKRSIGQPLVFRVVVHERHGGTKRLNYRVTVRR